MSQPTNKKITNHWLIATTIFGLFVLLAMAFIIVDNQEPNAPDTTKIIAETAAKSVEFESITTPGAERETVHIEIERVTVAKPIDNVKFVENPDSDTLLVRKLEDADSLEDNLSQNYTVLVPAKRLGVIKSQYKETFGRDLPLEPKQ